MNGNTNLRITSISWLAHYAEHRNRARMEFFVEIPALLHFMNVFTAMQIMLDCIVMLKQKLMSARVTHVKTMESASTKKKEGSAIAKRATQERTAKLISMSATVFLVSMEEYARTILEASTAHVQHDILEFTARKPQNLVWICIDMESNRMASMKSSTKVFNGIKFFVTLNQIIPQYGH